MLFAPCFMICGRRVAGSEVGQDNNMDAKVSKSRKSGRLGSVDNDNAIRDSR